MGAIGVRPVLLATICGVLFAASGCATGKLLLMDMPFEPPSIQPTRIRVGIQGVPRLESNKYQAVLESQIARVIEASGLFLSVTRGEFDPSNVDLVIQVEPAIVAWDRRPNMAYFPLAFATLTLYIWVGGPIVTDTEFYDLTLKMHDASGRHLFDVTTRQSHTHWNNLYRHEHRSPRCLGPHAGELIAELVKSLSDRLASEGFKDGRLSRNTVPR